MFFFANQTLAKAVDQCKFLKIMRGKMNTKKRVLHLRHSYCTAYMSYVSSTTPLFCTALSKVKDQSEIRFEKHCPFLLLEHEKKIKTFHTQVVCPARQMRSLSGLEFL